MSNMLLNENALKIMAEFCSDYSKDIYGKKFMILKRINLVDDPVNGNLKSVFILRKGERKLIDERAKGSLATRFEYKTKKNSLGAEVHVDGYMKFDLVEGELNPRDPFSRIFFISDGLMNMLDEENKVKFARHIAEIASEMPDEEPVPDFLLKTN